MPVALRSRGRERRRRSSYGGRWNSRGVRVVYASTSLALAAIETFVNLEPNLRPADLVSLEGELDDGIRISRLEPTTLPEGWHKGEMTLCDHSGTPGFAMSKASLSSFRPPQSAENGISC
jgi:RES domain-containing protein